MIYIQYWFNLFPRHIIFNIFNIEPNRCSFKTCLAGDIEGDCIADTESQEKCQQVLEDWGCSPYKGCQDNQACKHQASSMCSTSCNFCYRKQAGIGYCSHYKIDILEFNSKCFGIWF